MLEKSRCSGIDILGDVPWGTHFCQFYQTPEDLLEVLLGYFEQGLRNNEFCMWITSEPLGEEESRSALRRVVPDLDDRIDRGQIEFLDYRQWYLLDGQFDADRVLQGWIEKERDAVARGYDGLRVTGNLSWLDESNWKAFTDYEATVNNLIGLHCILALCTYPLDKCRGVEMLDVLRNHSCVLVKKGSTWEVIASPQQRKTMEKLSASEQQQKAILDNIPDPAWLNDHEGRYLAINSACCRLLGVDAKDALGKTAFEFLPAELAERVWKHHQVVMQSRLPLQIEESFRDMNGDLAWFETIKSPLLDERGEVVGTTGLARNITERKKGEEALRESEFKFRAVADNTYDWEFWQGEDGRLIYCSPSCQRITGHSPAEFLADAGLLEAIVHAEDRPAVSRHLHGDIPCHQATSLIFRIVTADGELRWIEHLCQPICDSEGHFRGLRASNRDITDRKQAESSLRESESRLRSFFDSPGIMRGIVEIVGNDILHISDNAVAARFFGRTPESMRNQYASEFGVPEDVRQVWIGHYEDCKRTKLPVKFEYFHESMGGGTWLFATVSFLETLSNGHSRYAYVVSDITELKRAEAANRQLAAIVNSSTDAIISKSLEGIVLSWNDGAEQLYGFSAEEAIGKPISILVPSDHLDELPEILAKIEHGERIAHYETVRKRKDGRRIHVSLSVSPLTDMHGRIVGASTIARDITDRKNAELALRENEDRLSFALEISNTGTWDLDIVNHTAHRSLRHDQIFGYESLLPAWTYEMFLEHVLPEDRKTVDWKFQQAIASGDDWSFECRIRRCDGHLRWIWAAGRQRTDASGKLTRMVGIVQDITERKQAEEKLRESEERFKVIASSTPDHLLVQTRELRYSLVVNPQMGLTEQDMIGKTDYDFLSHEDADRLTRIKRKVLETGESAYLESPLTSPKGDLEFFEGSYVPKYDSEGQIDGLIGYFRNVTDRKRTEASLQESEERYRSLFSGMTEGFALHEIICDEQGKPCDYRFLDINPAFEQQTGLKRNAVIGKTMREVLPQEHFYWIKKYGLVALTGQSTRFENHSAAFDKHFEVYAYRPAPGQFAVIFTDVTDRKRADDALRQSELFLKQTQKIARVGGWEANPHTDHLKWTEGVYDIIEAPRNYQPALSEGIRFFQPEYIPIITDCLAQCLATGDPFAMECQVTTTTGKRLWTELRGITPVVSGQRTYVMGTLQDISERKRVEERVIASEATLREAQEIACLGSYLLDIPRGRWTSSEVLDRIFDIPTEYAKTVEGWGNILHPDERQEMLDYLRYDVFEKHQPFDREYRIVRYVDQQVRWVHGLGRLEFDAAGHPITMIGTIQDITERKHAEESLREREEEYRQLVNLTLDGIFVVIDDRVVFANPAGMGLVGASRSEQVLGQPVLDFIHREDQSAVRDRMLEMHKNHNVASWAEQRIVRLDGSIVDVEVAAIPFVHLGRLVSQVIVRDLTDRKRSEQAKLEMERRLLHAQKLESLGVLAGGIAHDFNNLLAGIMGYADLAILRLPASEPVRADIEVIKKTVQKAADLTREMLAYSGKGKFIVEPINLSQIVEDSRRMLEVSVSKKAVLKWNLATDLPAIQADAAQIHQIVLNLVLNASEALGDENGEITISTEAIQCSDTDSAVLIGGNYSREGRYVRLVVADTGCGMDQETVAKIFDPFFTTKFTGRGLGLAAVHGIVQSHKGVVKVSSEPGKGTTFQVLFAASDATVNLSAGESISVNSWRGNGTVLVVDDEEIVRNMASRMIEHAGFTVVCAKDGGEAIQVYDQHKKEIVCVLLDLTMPKMSGEETFLAIRDISLEVPVILSSGYSEDLATERLLPLGLAGFIQKPYQYDLLITKLQRAVATDGESQSSANHPTADVVSLPKDGHSMTAKPLRGTVLVVDDDAMIREATQAAFRYAGFCTLEAKDGEDAICMYQKHQDQVDCIILDLTLPKMKGEVVFRELRKIRPDVRIVVTSGHSAEELKERFAGRDVFGFICKPETPKKVIIKLEKALGIR